MGFSERLSLLRRERGLSQRQAAAELGISQALLSHYEKALREPRLEFVVKCCDYYGVSADFILARTEDRSDERAEEIARRLRELSLWAEELTSRSNE